MFKINQMKKKMKINQRTSNNIYQIFQNNFNKKVLDVNF